MFCTAIVETKVEIKKLNFAKSFYSISVDCCSLVWFSSFKIAVLKYHNKKYLCGRTTSLRKIYSVKLTIKTFWILHTERRWKTHEWKINFAKLLNEILKAFNKILSHTEILKFEILFKPEIQSKHHHTCFCIFN